jgi:hypothetical protein
LIDPAADGTPAALLADPRDEGHRIECDGTPGLAPKRIGDWRSGSFGV